MRAEDQEFIQTRQRACRPAKGPARSQGRPSPTNKEDAVTASGCAGSWRVTHQNTAADPEQPSENKQPGRPAASRRRHYEKLNCERPLQTTCSGIWAAAGRMRTLALSWRGPVVQLIRGIFQIPVASIDHHLAGTLSKPLKYQQMFSVLEYFKPIFGLL